MTDRVSKEELKNMAIKLELCRAAKRDILELIAANIRTLDNMLLNAGLSVEINGTLYAMLHANTIIHAKYKEK